MDATRLIDYILCFFLFHFVPSECDMADSNESTVTINFYHMYKTTEEEGFTENELFSIFIKGESRFRKKIKQYCIFSERPNTNKNIDTD